MNYAWRANIQLNMESPVIVDDNELEGSEIVLNSIEMIKSEGEDEVNEDIPRRNGLFSITGHFKQQKIYPQDKSPIADQLDQYGETTSTTDSLENSPVHHQSAKTLRRKRMERSINNNGPITTPISAPDYHLHNNNNNHLKNERLSPGTPDTSSRSRSVTPSSASHPDTPPVSETPMRNYSDFMRSLAAKYNNTNPNDYFNAARNGFPPPLDPRFKPSAPFAGLAPLAQPPPPHPKEGSGEAAKRPPDFPVLNPFAGVPGAGVFPPLIDMSTTQTLIAMVRTAKEAEIQGLLKNVKRPETSSPLDLSAGAPPTKRPRTKTPSSSSQTGGVPTTTTTAPKRASSESPKLHEDVSNWSVDDVCNFVAGIDICAEYAQTFRDQRIDGAGLPLLTEDHLTSTMNMKLGPALKLRSILAKKLGSCSVCLHCSHCHNSARSPEHGNSAGNTSDSGGAS